MNADTLSLPAAAARLGIGKSTAYKRAHNPGELCPGVPVIWIGSVPRVSVFQLNVVLGIEEKRAS